MTSENLQRWHDVMLGGQIADLENLLAEEVVFWSPVVHTPQKGKMLTLGYLVAANKVLANGHFKYLREFDCGSRAVLEFETKLDGLIINGVDMIEWDEAGKITEFKVMLRPLKAVNAVHHMMGEELMRLQASMASAQ